MFHRHGFADHESLVLPHALGDGEELNLQFEMPSVVLPIQVARIRTPRLKASRTGNQLVLALLDGTAPISVLQATVCDHHLTLDNWPKTLVEWCMNPDQWPLVLACGDLQPTDWEGVRRQGDRAQPTEVDARRTHDGEFEYGNPT